MSEARTNGACRSLTVATGRFANGRRAVSDAVAFVSFARHTGSVNTFETFDLDEADRKALVALGDENDPLVLRAGDHDITLPPSASYAVTRLLANLASGASVHLLTEDDELTTQQAADILGLSRTYVVRLIDQASLPAHMVGTHRRLRASDVLAYRTQRDSRLSAVAAISAAGDGLGITG